MLKRYFLVFLGIVSLGWIAYVGFTLLNDNDDYLPANFFGKKDGKILIINRFKESSLTDFSFQLQPEVNRLFEKIAPALESSKMVVLSELQNQLYIEMSEKWTPEKISSFFRKVHLPVQFGMKNQFSVAGFEGVFHQSIFHLTKGKVLVPKKRNDALFSFDEKASASIIAFNGDKFSVSDVYNNDENITQYIAKQSFVKFGKQVDDQELFSFILPVNLENYHFWEKEFYTNFDPVYTKGPLHYWSESGFIETDHDGNQVLISDFEEGKDPFEVLTELAENEGNGFSQSSTHFQGIRLTEQFPSNIEEGFYMYKMENFVVISPSKSACDYFLQSFRPDDSLKISNQLFVNQLPKYVSERNISKSLVYSKSIYNNRLIETWIKQKK